MIYYTTRAHRRQSIEALDDGHLLAEMERELGVGPYVGGPGEAAMDARRSEQRCTQQGIYAGLWRARVEATAAKLASRSGHDEGPSK